MFKKYIFATVVFATIFSVQPALAESHSKSLSNLSASDIMFAQSMIPHHQQAIEISKLAAKNASSSEIKALAKAIIKAQNREIKQMKYWLTATNSAMEMQMDMGMNGMLSASTMKTLKTLKGAKFDFAFLKAMIAHHQGALKMVSYLDGSKNSEAQELAKGLVIMQSAEIVSMKKLLTKVRLK